MAKGKGSIQGWITKNGVHIPIYGTYTVREGHEPTVKGSRFKGGKKKKVDTSTTMGKTTKQLEDNLKKKGLVLEAADKADMAHKDFNDEKVTLYDNDGNVYRGTYNRYQNGDKEIVNIERDRSAEKVQAGQIEGKNPDRDEVRKSNHENMLAVKERIREKEAMEERKEKYANRDWNKDVDDAKRYGYSEQTEEGKKPVTKAEENRPKTSADNREERIKALKEKINAKTQERVEEYRKDDPNYKDGKYLKEQEGSTPVHPDQRKFASKKAYEKALAEYEGREYVEPTRKATSQPKETAPDTYRMNDMNWDHLKEVDDDYLKSEYKRLNHSKLKDYETDMTHDTRLAMRDELKRRGYSDEDPTTGRIYGPKKESSTPNYSKTSPGGATEWKNFSDAQVMDWAQDEHYKESATKEMYARGIGPREYQNYKNSKAQESSTPKSKNIEAIEWAGKYNPTTYKDVERAQQSSASDLHSRIQAQAEQADVHRQRTSVKKVQSPRTPKLVAPTEEMKRELGIDKDYGTHNLSAAKEAQARYKKSANWAKQKDLRYAKMAQEEKAKAQSIADAISGVTGIANSGSIQNMSPSGLKSAYAEATGARKTKLANELRKRGYQLTGGRWTKKKS